MSINLLLSILIWASTPNFQVVNNTANAVQMKVYVDGTLHESVLRSGEEKLFSAKDNILIHVKRLTNNCDDVTAFKQLSAGHKHVKSNSQNGWDVYSRKAPPDGYICTVRVPFNICQS